MDQVQLSPASSAMRAHHGEREKNQPNKALESSV